MSLVYVKYSNPKHVHQLLQPFEQFHMCQTRYGSWNRIILQRPQLPTVLHQAFFLRQLRKTLFRGMSESLKCRQRDALFRLDGLIHSITILKPSPGADALSPGLVRLSRHHLRQLFSHPLATANHERPLLVCEIRKS